MFLAGDEWQATLHGFSRSAWRLETLDVYTMPEEDEALREFRAGKRLPQDFRSGWTDRIREHNAAGRTIGRVHVLTRPLSEYLRFEFDYYRAHGRAGEDIRILDVTDRESPLAGVGDFWLFDDAIVVRMNYRPDGTQINRELVTGDTGRYLDYRRIALAESVPFEEYVTRFATGA
ncbi:MAG TPA: hypothetical protein VGN37_14855 [Actinocatenispora sp.]